MTQNQPSTETRQILNAVHIERELQNITRRILHRRDQTPTPYERERIIHLKTKLATVKRGGDA